MFCSDVPLLRHLVLSALLFIITVASVAAEPYRLIAHRGGVVDDTYAENSPAGTKAAIERGYWMLEVDVRESKDGRALMQHDADFRKYYGDPRLVHEMTWEEIAQLRATPGNSRPMLFTELVEMCRGKVRLMLDVKGDHALAFYQHLAETLAQYHMLADTMILGTPKTRSFFLDKARVQANRTQLEEAASAGELVASRYFLFEWGLEIDASAVRRANELEVTVVPSINWFHYERHNQDPLRGAERDIRNLQKLGVQHYQIDSIYEQFLR